MPLPGLEPGSTAPCDLTDALAHHTTQAVDTTETNHPLNS